MRVRAYKQKHTLKAHQKMSTKASAFYRANKEGSVDFSAEWVSSDGASLPFAGGILSRANRYSVCLDEAPGISASICSPFQQHNFRKAMYCRRL